MHDTPESGNIMDETAFRQKILEAVEEEGEYYEKLNEQLKNDPEYQLTPEKLEAFEKRLRRARRNPFRAVRSCGPHTYRRLNKVAVCISVLLVILIVGVVSVSSLRDYTINFLLSFDNTYAKSDTFKDIVSPNAPSILPKGYSFSSYKVDGDVVKIEYIDQDYNILMFTQRSIDNPTIIDTEDAKLEDVPIGEYQGKLSKKDNGQVVLAWQTDKFQFSLTSNIDIDLVPVAESVSIN